MHTHVTIMIKEDEEINLKVGDMEGLGKRRRGMEGAKEKVWQLYFN